MTKPILDAFPYPFPDPMAQELLRVLARQYRDEDEAVALVERHGVDPLKLHPGLSPMNRWHEMLEKTANAGTTRELVQAVRDSNPRHPRSDLLDALLHQRTIPVSAEPIEDHSKTFRVTHEEALLFRDDLTIPIPDIAGLIATLEAMRSAASAVCLLRTTTSIGEFFGTGFRIGNELVLTNEHVLFPRHLDPLRVSAQFHSGVAGATVHLLAGDITTIIADRADDWGILRVPGMDNTQPILDLAAAPPPNIGDRAYIIQHPGGRRKCLGYVRNLVTDLDARVVHYLTDTEHGSSGSPVFDAQGRVFALHHVGGDAITIAGELPISKNEGILISRVLADMKAKGVKI